MLQALVAKIGRNEFYPGASITNQPWQPLDVNPSKLILNLQNDKWKYSCCFKPLNLWQFVTAATGKNIVIKIYFISCIPVIYFFLEYNSLSSIFHSVT